MSLKKNCAVCELSFEITDEALSFYNRISPIFEGEKMQMQPPTLCPECRQRRRIVWRNERFLYHAVCFLCRKKIITLYPPTRKFPVLCQECFWSDRWDAQSFGRAFNFNRPFFNQFAELYAAVPQLSIFQAQCINSEYTLNNFHNKNCYMLSGADYNEDCMYGLNTQRSKDCVDHILLYDSQLCYGCLWSANMYNCVGCQDCENCSDSWFLFDCKGCSSCALSANLRNKQYVLYNEQLTKEEYERRLKKIMQEIFQNPFWLFENLERVREKAIQRATTIINGENVSGNYIRNSKNSHDVFDAEDLEDCRFCYYALDIKDCGDASCIAWGELMYDSISMGKVENVLFSSSIIESHNVYYSRCVWNSADIFGSTSIKNHQQYLILNKKYTREEYQMMVQKIIEHMKKTGEWGEFFPPQLSPFEYNRSMAIDHMPLTKDEALERGFRWYDEEETSSKSAVDKSLPLCVNCGKNFRIIQQEIDFYKKKGIPEPHLCWPCRVQRLIKQRRFYQLFNSSCTKCGMKIKSAIPPGGKNTIYCEKCYLESVY